MNFLLLDIVNVNTCFGSSETISINSMRSVLRILSCPIQVGIYVFYSLTFIAVQCKIVSSKEIQLWNKILMTLSSNHLVRTFKLQYFNCHEIASVQNPSHKLGLQLCFYIGCPFYNLPNLMITYQTKWC